MKISKNRRSIAKTSIYLFGLPKESDKNSWFPKYILSWMPSLQDLYHTAPRMKNTEGKRSMQPEVVAKPHIVVENIASVSTFIPSKTHYQT